MTEDFDNFVEEVNEFALKNYENGLFLPKILYDVEISEDRLTLDFAESLTLFEPTGYGNSQPVFKLKDRNRLFFKNEIFACVKNLRFFHLACFLSAYFP